MKLKPYLNNEQSVQPHSDPDKLLAYEIDGDFNVQAIYLLTFKP